MVVTKYRLKEYLQSDVELQESFDLPCTRTVGTLAVALTTTPGTPKTKSLFSLFMDSTEIREETIGRSPITQPETSKTSRQRM